MGVANPIGVGGLMKVEDMKGGYTTGSCATAGMKAGLLALLDKMCIRDRVCMVHITNHTLW